MGIPRYLAMTAAELSSHPPAPHIAWMACHFSAYHSGLSNLPEKLPKGSLLILDDSVPMEDHDPELIKSTLFRQIQTLSCSGLLLDFQRPGSGKVTDLAAYLTADAPVVTAVSALYAQELNCPVLVPPCPVSLPLREHLAPWAGRDIWLEIAMDAQVLTLTEAGCVPSEAGGAPEAGFEDEALHCHYTVETGADYAKFTLWRRGADLDGLLGEAEKWGVRRAVGLWQELGR